MHLIRAESLGSTNNQGYKRYTQIFTGSPHRHIRPNLTSVHWQLITAWSMQPALGVGSWRQ